MNTSARAIHVWAARVSVLLVLMALVCLPGNAQTFRGTILGTVTDKSGGVVPGAKVIVRNADTGLTREAQTTDDGSYAVPELPIGNYTVTVEKANFRTVVTTGVRVDVAGERRVDVTLQPGDVAQRIEVSAETLPLVETTTNLMGGTIEASQALNLPVNGRDYQKLIYMVPGITGSPDQITDSPGSFGVFSMNGARGRSNNFLLDGTDMNDGYRNDPAINEAGVFGTPATILPVEAVAELRVLSNYEAEYGRNAGAVINIVTKSGTNDFHGTAFEYFRNNALDARNFFNDKTQPQNPFHNNQFGGFFGGPIIRDKTFFFADYEGLRESGAQASLACVPTPAQIAFDGGASNPVIAGLLTRNPWPAPNRNIQPASAARDAGCPEGPNLATSTPFRNRVDSVIAKIDHNFSRDHLLTGRYYFGDSDQSFPLALVGGGILPGFNTFTPTRVQLVSISYVSLISPTKVNEARFGWNRFAEGFFPEDQNFDPNSIGLNTGVGSRDFGLPVIAVSGFAQLGASKTTPRNRVDTNWHFIDNFSWKFGRHDVKFGYEFRRTSIAQVLDTNFRGKLSFDSLSDFLAGNPGGGSQAKGNSNRNTFENNHGFYLQDSIRWTRRLTLNLGARWDYYGVVHEKRNLFSNFDFTNGLRPVNELYEPDYNNFAPRVSVAWDVTGKGRTVIRAGYGLFYDAFSQDFFMGHLPFNSGFDPGPAYNPTGAAAFIITSGSANAGPLATTAPVFGGFANNGDLFAVDRNIRTPYMQNYNLNIQQQIGGHAMLQVGYVGSNGHKLFRFRDINQPSQAAIRAADLACDCSSSGGVPRPNTAFFYINQQESSANSNYQALQVSFRMRGWHGLDSTLNYVWSHSIDDASDGEDFVPNAAQPNDSLRPNLEKGNSNFDVRQRLVWNFIYEFPKRKGSWSRLTDGWGVNGVLTLQSGQPFHLNYNFQGDYDGSGEFFGRPDVPGPIRYNRGDPNQFLDLTSSSFTICPTIPTSPTHTCRFSSQMQRRMESVQAAAASAALHFRRLETWASGIPSWAVGGRAASSSH
ncbi:MAG: TonB-dependent receptor [Acidobacteria bacterium]|nr:TonB-dependent receptor [Acidobacteriota bacterium]